VFRDDIGEMEIVLGQKKTPLIAGFATTLVKWKGVCAITGSRRQKGFATTWVKWKVLVK
jgi:hypothetical protein